jgi:hypothetical protein
VGKKRMNALVMKAAMVIAGIAIANKPKSKLSII